MKKLNAISKVISDTKTLRDDYKATKMITSEVEKAFLNRHKKAAVVCCAISVIGGILQAAPVIIEAINEAKNNKELAANDNEANRD